MGEKGKKKEKEKEESISQECKREMVIKRMVNNIDREQTVWIAFNEVFTLLVDIDLPWDVTFGDEAGNTCNTIVKQW